MNVDKNETCSPRPTPRRLSAAVPRNTSPSCYVFYIYIVTYSGFYSRWNFIALQKVNTLQFLSETLGTHVHVRPARSRNTHSYWILPTRPLVAIFQHSLPFLQSESYQIHVGTIHRRAIGPLAHHNGTSAYSPSLTCTSPDDRMSSSSAV
jgi:hypothetical protein